MPKGTRRVQLRRVSDRLIRDCATRLDRLRRLDPRSHFAGRLRAELEHLVHEIVHFSGIRDVERLIGGVNARGGRFVLEERGPAMRRWVEHSADAREISIQVWRARALHASSIHYYAPHVVRPTPRQQATKALHDAFYHRYMAAGRAAYASPPGRLPAAERLILLVGELEADVNNGGFAQYLSNKGTRRARSALAALERIGARRTAAMLRQALVAGEASPLLAGLDSRFVKSPEDLAARTMKHLSV
jgi:hypothetical protein